MSSPVKFRPRARLLSLLGEQLISDQAVGLIELVKNSYDADATSVLVQLQDLRALPETRIIVLDNGFGMTRSDIEEKWLSPAIDHKERQKAERVRTPKGRLPIGEKGVGRFAVHQLGHHLQLITRSASSQEVLLEIDWDEFDSGETFLDELSVTLYERPPETFVNGQSGTMIIISGARTLWTEAIVKRVQRALRRLQSPHREKLDFTIEFECSDFPSLQNIDASDITEKWHYRFRGMIDQDGVLDYEYQSKLPGLPERRSQNDGYQLAPSAANELTGLKPTCGQFAITFYVWDRRTDLLRASDVSRKDLDALAGVALFRDDLRVLPYGEPGNDWLDLDKERINDPSRRIGNQQIIGFVEVRQTDTPALRDKTNREGLIENEAFHDLRALVRAAITVFTSEWLRDRPQTEDGANQENVAPDSLQKARSLAQALEGSARDDVLVKVPASENAQSHPDESNKPQQSALLQADPKTDAMLPGASHDTITPQSITQRQAVSILVNHLLDAEDYEKKRQDEQRQQAEILLHLAATGMAAERVAHEFGRQIGAALEALGDLRPYGQVDEQGSRLIEIIDACLGMLRNEYRILAPYEINWRLQRTSPVSILDSLEIALNLNREEIKKTRVEVYVDDNDFEIQARPASLAQVFDNLINNSIMWLSTVERSERIIEIGLIPERREVIISDNGPGIPKHMYEQVFEPFVSMRNGGRGLGLYISREILASIGATISVEDPQGWTNLGGASFRILFYEAS